MCRSKWISTGKKPDIPVQATFREKVDEKRYEVLIKKTPPEKKSECSPHQKHDILCALELSSDDSADEIDSIFRFVFSTCDEENKEPEVIENKKATTRRRSSRVSHVSRDPLFQDFCSILASMGIDVPDMSLIYDIWSKADNNDSALGKILDTI